MTPRTRHSVEAGEVEIHDCLNDDGTDLVVAVLKQSGLFKGDHVAIVVQPKPDQIGKPKIKYHGPAHYHIHVWRTVKAPQNLKPVPDYPPQQLQRGTLDIRKGTEDTCDLCGLVRWTRRVPNVYYNQGSYGYAHVCESCYPKTQPKCTNKMCKDGEMYCADTPTHRAPCPTCRQKEYHTWKSENNKCECCKVSLATMHYRDVTDKLNNLCYACYSYQSDKIRRAIFDAKFPAKPPYSITKVEKVPTPSYNWVGCCPCGFTCTSSESWDSVEKVMIKHRCVTT